MDKTQEHAVPNEVTNAIDQLNEENAKAYLRDVVSIVQGNQDDKAIKLYKELNIFF
ncbi:hypothetical protein [Virgibacillus sp. L01]|uniref:hypothetical protein n=1 Tax=Virgibacillus sp. L01 TaxID=3457429 RepID=UPI003FD6238B